MEIVECRDDTISGKLEKNVGRDTQLTSHKMQTLYIYKLQTL